jgi:hypothetical protein
VDAAQSDPPTPRARAAARDVQWREQERAARKKEKRIRQWERREQESEEYRLCEQQGLPPGNSREPIIVGGGGRGERRGVGPSREVDSPAPAVGRSERELAHAAEAPTSTAGAPPSAAAATTGATTAPVEPSRKRKRSFSNLR